MIKKYSSKNRSKYSFLVVSGAMQIQYDQYHPLVNLLVKNYGDVYSLELPGHGGQSKFFADNFDQSLQHALQIVYENIDKICPKENLIIVAYSIGSLMIIKLLDKMYANYTNLKVIIIGSSLRLRDESSKLIRKFFNKTLYRKLGWEPVMIKQHGETWVKTVELIDEWMMPNSGIIATEIEIGFLLKRKNDLLFIIGDKDQPFNKDDTLFSGDFNVKSVIGDHFGYFLKSKSWPQVEEIITNEFVNWDII